MNDFAFEFPIRVFIDLMGLPQSDMKQFLAWEHQLLHGMSLEEVAKASPDPFTKQEANKALMEILPPAAEPAP